MKLKILKKNLFILAGYMLSVCGGVFGIIIGLFLIRKNKSESIRDGRTIIMVSIATSVLVLVYLTCKLVLKNNDVPLILYFFHLIASAILGGYIAFRKKDYPTRGFFIALFTGVWGVAVLLCASESNSRDKKRADKHYWPEDAWIAILLSSFNILLILILSKLIG